MKRFLTACLLFLSLQLTIAQSVLPYKNPKLPIEKRVEDLVSRMTLEEKFFQMYMLPFGSGDSLDWYKHGVFGLQFSSSAKSSNGNEQMMHYAAGNSAYEAAKEINAAQLYFKEHTRLGIPIIPFDEGLHGLNRAEATAFPQAIGLAATWDLKLMNEVANAEADEVKARGIRQLLSPVINIASDVRWGRTEETYGEDPFLCSQMSVAFVSAFEQKGIITTPKHFVANLGDGGRDSYPIHHNDRLMEEVYFPPFKASIQQGHSTSIMTSYNSYDGTQCSANDWLLNQKLKKEWGFKGFVISDAGATGGANVLHFTAHNYAESTQQAINNGLDVIFQTSFSHVPLFIEAFNKGMIRQTAIDSAVSRILYAKFKLGLFENPYVDAEALKKVNYVEQHKDIAKKAAQESIVLLKNDKNILPLSKNIKSVAVIGLDAVEGRLGGYSREGKAVVNILQGIKNKIDSTKVKYVEGCGRETKEYMTIPSSCLSHTINGKKEEGLLAEYFNNITLSGTPVLTRTDKDINFGWTLFSPDQEKVNYDYFSARWTGKLKATETGIFKVGIKGDDGYRLYLNDTLIIDNWKKQSVQTITKDFYFEKGKEYDIRIEFYETVGSVHLNLVWDMGVINDRFEKIMKAVLIAEKSDVTIVVAGIEEGEFRDRAYLTLPLFLESIIYEITFINKPLILVLVGGSAVTMTNAYNKIGGILDVWYPGDQGGNAVADVLFGDYNPAGRLPIAFPVDVAQLPYTYYHKPTGRGDDYMNLTGKPLYPFGYGLSYTQFSYSDMHFSKKTIDKTDSTIVSFSIKNIGTRDGDEVVQLYIKDLFASVARPMMELKGFQRVHLKAGETREFSFSITPELLSMLDKGLNTVVEEGEFRIMIGASSNDIRLRDVILVK